VQRQIVCDYMTRHSMVFTNVPGPTEPILLFGKRVRDIVFACANIINQVSVLSYAGHLRLTLVVDSDVTPDAEYIGQMFSEEIAALKAVYS
jgi:diacylglycerol O-acyltransferase / wax synthase